MFQVGYWKELKRIYWAYVPRGTLEGRHRPLAERERYENELVQLRGNRHRGRACRL